MSRDAPIKAEKDYSDILAEQLPQIEVLAKSDYKAALEKLLLLEKQTRQSSDLASSKRIVVEIVTLLVDHNDWDLLDEELTLLSKKHGQMKATIQTMVQEITKKLDNSRVKSMETIRTVTENKIFVEVERAHVTRMLSQLRLAEGKLDEATDLLCELQVETYGSMEMSEKIEFILEQMSLSIQKGDYQQATVLSRKILKRVFKDKYQDLKLQYYELLIKIDLHYQRYLEVAQHYLAIYDKNSDSWASVLTRVAFFLILSPYDNLQSDLIHKIQLDNNLKKLEVPKKLVTHFTTAELMRWSFIKDTYASELSSVFTQQHMEELHKRVVEHNLRTIASYYTRITLARLQELLDLSEKDTETYISKMVNQGIIFAKINRPQKLVKFGKPQNSNDLLNQWSSDVDELLAHIETIGHLITKEEIIYG